MMRILDRIRWSSPPGLDLDKGDPDISTRLGPINLKTPVVGASGTLGSLLEFRDVTDFRPYGAAVAKSVAPVPWLGRPSPRVGSVGTGMLNGIGIQNPGVEAWVTEIAPRLGSVPTRVWGSVVGGTPDEFAFVAQKIASAGIEAIEVNLSCPNLDGHLFALDPVRSAAVIEAVRGAVEVPIGAKLSPNAERIADVAHGCAEAGADWVVLTNTVLGAAIDITTRRPVLSGVVGGYSGAPLKPISLRCVIEVHRAIPELPILGVGGVSTADDVIEYLLAGASAVGVGTAHFAEPGIVSRIVADLPGRLRAIGARSVKELIGAMQT